MEQPKKCRKHPYAKEKDFILVVVKKTGEPRLACSYCEYYKEIKKAGERKEWENHKKNLTDYYIRKIMIMNSKMKMTDIPQELVDLKRAQLQLERLATATFDCKKHGKLGFDDMIRAGYQSSGNPRYKCRRCMKDMHRSHYERNKEKYVIKQRIYRAENAEQVKEKKRLYYQSYKERRSQFYVNRKRGATTSDSVGVCGETSEETN